MEQFSGYEIAQKRIEGRQRRRTRLIFWIVMLIMSAILFALGGRAGTCAVPPMLIFGFFAITNGIQLYFASSRGAPSPEMVEDEMGWLFGDDWRDMAGTQEFMLAQERIRRRRTRRAYFYLNAIAFLLVNAVLLYVATGGLTQVISGSTGRIILLPVLWLMVLAGHATRVFGSRQGLAKHERQIGQAILAEMQRSVPESEKRKDKPKHDVQYRVGEDGELVEVDYEFTFDDDEKPKRDEL